MANELNFLAEQSDEPETAPEVQVEAPAETETAAPRERGPDGKFVSKASEAPEAPEAAPAAAHAPDKPESVPMPALSALLDEREKRQGLEKQLAALRAQTAPPPPPTPDQALEQRLRAVTLTASRKFAEKEYGKELLATVHDWAAKRCDADPAFNQQMFATDDPYEAAVQAYNREQVLATVNTPAELAEFNAWKAAKAQAGQSPAQTPQSTQTPLPRSLVTAPGNGAVGKDHVPTGPEQAFASAFPT